ncbi:biotin transporter BioY [Frigoribacterium sp. UYMn621]|uniref:biotin transporter BioY n=1 Tax=Frigoribacterium sp. UYMn621 TaxID=3156343 RepID=UPI00339349C2
MSTLTLATGRSTLADRVFTRGIATDVVLIVAGAVLTAVAAQLAVPLWPVPITGQTLAVLVVGSTLGAARGSIAMLLYAVLGIIGLPVFSDATHGLGVVAGPTGGYIVGFVFAAALTGWLAQRAWDHRIIGAIASFAAGTLVTFAIGLPWLAFSLGLNLEQTLAAGLYPFVLGGIVKALLAAGFIRLAWFGITRSDSAKPHHR